MENISSANVTHVSERVIFVLKRGADGMLKIVRKAFLSLKEALVHQLNR